MERFEDFESVLQSSLDKSKIQEGALLSGRIVKVEDGNFYIDIGLKSFGKVSMMEFSDPKPVLDDMVQVVLTNIEGSDGMICLSHEEVKKSEVKKELWIAFQDKQKVPGIAIASYKAGLKVSLSGVMAFLPRNQIDNKSPRGADIPLNVPMLFVISNMDEECRSIMVSLREARDLDKKIAKREFIEKFEVGQILENCIVKNVANYGAFVDVTSGDAQGYDGLLHVTDISWKRIHHPTQVGIEKGTILPKIIILKVDKETGHVSLGMKQLGEDPWTVITKKAKIGDVIDGIVSNIAEYGAFIELADFNIEGLAHISELSWESKNINPTDILNQNQKVKVQILAIDPDKRRISLSVKRCMKNPWTVVAEEYPQGSEIDGIVKNITSFGLAVEIANGVRGMVHITDLSWVGDGSEALKIYKVGDKVKARVLSVTPEQNRMKLGIKQLTENPNKQELNNLAVGMSVPCVVTSVLDTEIEVMINDSVRGFVRKAEIAMDRDLKRTDRFKIGETIAEAQIINIREDASRIELSIKKCEEAEYSHGMKEFGANAPSSVTLSEMLGK